MLRHFTAHQIERLNAVRALVDLGDTCVPHQLLHSGFADVSVAAEDLEPEIRSLETVVGKEYLDDRRHQGDQILRLRAVVRVRMSGSDIYGSADPQDECACSLVVGPHGEQIFAHVRVDDNRIGGLIRELGSCQRAALQPLPGVGNCRLIGCLG